MYILLPPSETKKTPTDGPVFQPAALTYPELTQPRTEVLQRLSEVSANDNALEILKVGPQLRQAVLANTSLATAPAAPAGFVYTGVLYHAGKLNEAAANSDCIALVFSALWGVIALTDRIPAYRLSIGAKLKPFAPLASWWRPHLAAVLDEEFSGHLIVDCRSSSYQNMWRPTRSSHTVTIEVVRVTGTERKVVSHHAKYLRGVLAGGLLRQGSGHITELDDFAHLADQIARTHGPVPTKESVIDVELTADKSGHRLTFVTAL